MGSVALLLALCGMAAAFPQSLFHLRTPTQLELDMRQRQVACNFCDAIGYIIITFIEEDDTTIQDERSEPTTVASIDEKPTTLDNVREIELDDAYMYNVGDEMNEEIRRKREDSAQKQKPCCRQLHERGLVPYNIEMETHYVDENLVRMKRDDTKPGCCGQLKEQTPVTCCGNRRRREAEDLLRNPNATNAEKLGAFLVILRDLKGFCRDGVSLPDVTIEDTTKRNKRDISKGCCGNRQKRAPKSFQNSLKEVDELLKIRRSLCGQIVNSESLMDNRPKRDSDKVLIPDRLKRACCGQLREFEQKINIRVPRECNKESENCCGQLDEPDCCRSLNKREAKSCCGNRKKRASGIGSQGNDYNDSGIDDIEEVTERNKKVNRHPCTSIGDIPEFSHAIAFICIENYDLLGPCDDNDSDVNCCKLAGELRKECFFVKFMDEYSESLLTLNEELGSRKRRSVASAMEVPQMITIYPARND